MNEQLRINLINSLRRYIQAFNQPNWLSWTSPSQRKALLISAENDLAVLEKNDEAK